jgi:hypothetical protein
MLHHGGVEEHGGDTYSKRDKELYSSFHMPGKGGKRRS